VLDRKTDTSNRVILDRDGEIRFGSDADNTIEPASRVRVRVRMRKSISQIDPNVSIIRMPHDCIAIAPLPTPHGTRR
jgi:hypothetical protein